MHDFLYSINPLLHRNISSLVHMMNTNQGDASHAQIERQQQRDDVSLGRYMANVMENWVVALRTFCEFVCLFEASEYEMIYRRNFYSIHADMQKRHRDVFRSVAAFLTVPQQTQRLLCHQNANLLSVCYETFLFEKHKGLWDFLMNKLHAIQPWFLSQHIEASKEEGVRDGLAQDSR